MGSLVACSVFICSREEASLRVRDILRSKRSAISKSTHRLDLVRHPEEPTERRHTRQLSFARDPRQVRDHRALREPADDDPFGRDPGVDFLRDERGDGPDGGEHANVVFGADAGVRVQFLDVEPDRRGRFESRSRTFERVERQGSPRRHTAVGWSISDAQTQTRLRN